MYFFLIFLKIKSFFVKKPTKFLSWSKKDFEIGKKWAKTQPHPTQSFKTLWDYCNDPQESVYTLRNINNFIQI